MSGNKKHALDSIAEFLPKGFEARALESLQLPAGLFDKDFKVLWMNNSMGFVHGCRPRNAVGKPCYKVLKDCNIPCEECCITEVVETGRTVVTETWVDLPKGGRRWGDMYAYPIRGEEHDVEAIFVLAFDTTRHVLKEQKRAAEAAQSASDALLSPREIEVLRLLAEGYTNTQISDVLDISAHTVKTHVTGVFNKLGVNDRTMAAVQAVRRNII